MSAVRVWVCAGDYILYMYMYAGKRCGGVQQSPSLGAVLRTRLGGAVHWGGRGGEPISVRGRRALGDYYST